MISELFENRLVGFPSVRDREWSADPDRLAHRMGVEDILDTASGHDNARVTMAGQQDAQATGLEVELRGSGSSGQWVQYDDDMEFPALKAVGGVNGDGGDIEARFSSEFIQSDSYCRSLNSMHDS